MSFVFLLLTGCESGKKIDNSTSDTEKTEEKDTIKRDDEGKIIDKYTQIDTSKFDATKYNRSIYFLNHEWQYPWAISDLQEWELELNLGNDNDLLAHTVPQSYPIVSKDDPSVKITQAIFFNAEEEKRNIYECNL